MRFRISLAAIGASAALLCSASSALADNSTAAHVCQHGGYNAVVGAQGQTFSNAGECTSFAAHGGQFATGMIIPAGETATISDAQLGSCNGLTYGYELNFGALIPIDSKSDYCGSQTANGATLGPYPTAELLQLYLSDDSCSFTFLSSDPTHASVTGNNPYSVGISDGGGNCQSPPGTQYGPPFGNLTATVTIS